MKFFAKLSSIFGRRPLDDSFFDDLETALIESDVGAPLSAEFVDAVRRLKDEDEVRRVLAEKMAAVFAPVPKPGPAKPRVVLVLGVNGAGKTTTIAKLACNYKNEGKKVLLVAADTFRAAAVEQLAEWGRRLELEVVSQETGADSAAVAFDGVQKAAAKGFDVVLIDTAGRLHTKQNLMEELKKVSRVIGKACDGAPHEKILVLDATVGSNGLSQAREFHKALGLTGIIVTKLDGTAKGGVLFAVAGELKLPITHVGAGEKMGDLRPFSPDAFVRDILRRE